MTSQKLVKVRGTGLSTQVRTLAERAAEQQRLTEVAAEIFELGTPENTRLAYTRDWRAFVTWATEWGAVEFDERGRPLEPVGEGTTLLYLTHLADIGRKPNTVERALSGITWVHGVHYPDVKLRTRRVKEMVRKIRIAKGSEVHQAAALLPEDLKRMVARMSSPPTPLELRDRALLLVGWAGAFRRSELAALDFDDLEFSAHGVAVTLRRAKTDQEGRGVVVAIPLATDEELCPVRALQAWVDYRKPRSATKHVFCKSLRSELWFDTRMRAQQNEYVMKRWVRRAELTPNNPKEGYSPHSLRAGFITTAASNGRPDTLTMEHSRHKTHRIFMGYVRRGRRFDDHPGKGLL